MISQAGDLARRLAREAEAVCRHYLPHGRRRGRYWVAGDVDDTPGRSLYVRLSGPDSGPGAAGKWTDAATGEHGDLLDLIGRSRASAAPRRRNRRGPRSFSPCRALRAPMLRPGVIARLRIGGSRAPPVRCRTSGSRHAGRAYLRARGITARLDWPALRFHPSVCYRESEAHPREAWPALLAAVTDPAGTITGIQRTWLDRSGTAKAPSPIRAAPSAISSATASASAAVRACPRMLVAAGEGVERCWRSPRYCRRCR